MPFLSRPLASSAHSTVPWVSYVCLASSMALVGSYVGLSKLLVAVFPVMLLAWLRFGIAAVAMAGWVRRQPGESPLSRRDRWLLFWESFFGNFLFSVSMLFGVSMTSALAAGVIMAAIPAVVAVFSWALLKERISGPVKLGIACAVAGIALLSLGKSDAQAGAAQVSLLGNLLLFAAVCCEALYVVIGKQLTGNVSAKRISALVNLWGFALVTPFGAALAWQFDFSAVSAASWGLLAFYSLAASMITVWLWMTGLKHVPAASAGVFTVLLPVSTALVGVGLLGERFTGLHAVAFGLALAGVILATWSGRRAS
ncbi:DMT family transporter [Schlegelella aquatica]|uniref:DMT family transporter n=1 Tax=Caldimonas aquatica TaxID=376175 RepID=UPI003751E8BA